MIHYKRATRGNERLGIAHAAASLLRMAFVTGMLSLVSYSRQEPPGGSTTHTSLAATDPLPDTSKKVYELLLEGFSAGGNEILAFSRGYSAAVRELEGLLSQPVWDWAAIANACERIAIALEQARPTMVRIDPTRFERYYNEVTVLLRARQTEDEIKKEEYAAILARYEKQTDLDDEQRAELTMAQVGTSATSFRLEWTGSALSVMEQLRDTVRDRNTSMDKVARIYGHMSQTYREIAKTVRVAQETRVLLDFLDRIVEDSRDVTALLSATRAQCTRILDEMNRELLQGVAQ